MNWDIIQNLLIVFLARKTFKGEKQFSFQMDEMCENIENQNMNYLGRFCNACHAVLSWTHLWYELRHYSKFLRLGIVPQATITFNGEKQFSFETDEMCENVNYQNKSYFAMREFFVKMSSGIILNIFVLRIETLFKILKVVDCTSS